MVLMLVRKMVLMLVWKKVLMLENLMGLMMVY